MKHLATGIVSERACHGLDHFVAQAVKGSLAQPGTDFAISPTDDKVVNDNEREVVMLTVSSYLFRVLLFIHFDRNPALRSHLAALDGHPGETLLDEDRFTDAMMERGNLCCGALNRDLAHFFPHIGMSTPCILKRSSVEHVAAVNPAFTRRYRAEVGAGVAMHFTLALCAFADLDFPFEPRAAEEVEDTAGELEMF
ncbi:MAG: hypothetical protein Tsb007_20830 [Rhizobacter sp.]